jgi:diguanylate cyclase (GGDEF)-like protein
MNVFRPSTTTSFLFNLFLVIVIGTINHLIVTDITLLYLIPILRVSWFVGTWAGTILSLLSAGLWLVYDASFVSVNATPLFHAWQAMIRFILFLSTAITIARLKKELDKERQLSRSDELTNVANRRYFFDALNTELEKLKRYRHPLTLMYIDVDDFKSINDRFGHDAGDDFLRLVASILADNTRTYDLVARLGGDEFAVLLPETDFPHARETARKLHKRLEEARSNKNQVTFSFGSLTLAKAPASADEAVRMADEIMYSVKKSGKNSTKTELYGEQVTLAGV